MMLDWFMLLFLIAIVAMLITTSRASSREVYLYVCLVLGGLINDIKNIFKKKGK